MSQWIDDKIARWDEWEEEEKIRTEKGSKENENGQIGGEITGI